MKKNETLDQALQAQLDVNGGTRKTQGRPLGGQGRGVFKHDSEDKIGQQN